MNIYLNKKNFYIFILFYSLLAIFFALYIEYILGYKPCKLCLYQRIPYILSTIICFFGYFFYSNKIFIYLLIFAFLSSLFISGYHLGIENNIFTEFSGCTNENLNTTNKTELLESLNNYMPNCKSVSFRILGLSLATINFILSIALTLITITYLYYEKNR